MNGIAVCTKPSLMVLAAGVRIAENTGAMEITALLANARCGDREALECLVPLVNTELRRLARNHLRAERSGHTLQPTDLIHEAYLRLLQGSQPEWESRTHFYSIAARLMRQILTDHARARASSKRGWDANVTLEHARDFAPRTPTALLVLDDALAALDRVDPRKSRAIELRYFGGLTIDEIATVLDVSIATVGRDLRMGEAWLRREIGASSRSVQQP
jgi:RNA polymerase sigma factor (TIGR02999 family)